VPLWAVGKRNEVAQVFLGHPDRAVHSNQQRAPLSGLGPCVCVRSEFVVQPRRRTVSEILVDVSDLPRLVSRTVRELNDRHDRETQSRSKDLGCFLLPRSCSHQLEGVV